MSLLKIRQKPPSFKTIPLTKGKVVKVSPEDYEMLSYYSWHLSRGGAATSIRGHRLVLMHRLLLSPDGDKHVDHINHDRLDNRRENLRIATHQQNNANKRPWHKFFKGVKYRPQKSTKHKLSCERPAFVASFQGKQIGRYFTAVEAAKAYDDSASKKFGEYAYLNFDQRFDLVRFEKLLKECPEIIAELAKQTERREISSKIYQKALLNFETIIHEMNMLKRESEGKISTPKHTPIPPISDEKQKLLNQLKELMAVTEGGSYDTTIRHYQAAAADLLTDENKEQVKLMVNHFLGEK